MISKKSTPIIAFFFTDPNPPLSSPREKAATPDWKELLQKYEQEHGQPLKHIKLRGKNRVPKDITCHNCEAPSIYLYYNDGKKRSQIKCKVCNSFSVIQHQRRKPSAKWFCPYCNCALYLWKHRKEVSIFKCCNDNCPHYLTNNNKLNLGEKILSKIVPSQFKLRYHYREYHFSPEQLQHSKPSNPGSIAKIRNSLNILALVLTFHVSFAISARKTAYILREVFKLPMSYQTVLNYSQMAAYCCHNFNLTFKGKVDDTQAGDEGYIKIRGKNAYVFLFISVPSLKITAYHVDHSRGTLPATIAMKEALSTADSQQKISFIADGNPSYQAALHFLNQSGDYSLDLKRVIGLQNLDKESEEYRHFKQIVERLNRTYRYHIRAANGFKCKNGAVALTTLIVTHYNFLRPHHTLKYKTPVPLDFLQGIDTLQGRWTKIINTSLSLEQAA